MFPLLSADVAATYSVETIIYYCLVQTPANINKPKSRFPQSFHCFVSRQHNNERDYSDALKTLKVYIIYSYIMIYFRYNADLDSDPYGEALWYFNYFFYNKRMKRLLFFSCQAQPYVFIGDIFKYFEILYYLIVRCSRDLRFDNFNCNWL